MGTPLSSAANKGAWGQAKKGRYEYAQAVTLRTTKSTFVYVYIPANDRGHFAELFSNKG